MTTWPHRIPFDLHKELEAHTIDGWQGALRAWAKTLGLKLKIQSWRQLEITIADPHSRRYMAKPKGHWAAIKEWLERHEVPAPDKLPGWPEVDSVTNY
ncbi:hypothetical protein [Ruegeria atlantica]|uniref:hypothetical protein n=1 Tax=Ruegeria atlantica TaxID=81569 RepID=UPI00147DBE60|nr:hypothetical protein [Ruegeria atlantica]